MQPSYNSRGDTPRASAGSSSGSGSAIENALKKIGFDARQLQRFDLYTKVDEDESVQTSSGAILSLGSWVIIFLLLCSEFSGYFHPPQVEHMVVDTSLNQKLPALHY